MLKSLKSKLTSMQGNQGFTLVELLVVVAIIALLATVGISSYRSLNSKARDGRREADVQEFRSALEVYRTDVGNYPPTGGVGDLVPNFIKEIPKDPKTGVAYQYERLSLTTYQIIYTLENGGQQTARQPL